MGLLRYVILCTVVSVATGAVPSRAATGQAEFGVNEIHIERNGQLDSVYDQHPGTGRSHLRLKQRDGVSTDDSLRSGEGMSSQLKHQNSSSNGSTTIERRGFSVFDGQDPHPARHLKECTDYIFKGQCFDHVIKPEGSCFRRHFAPTGGGGSMRPEKGVICDMFPIFECKYGDLYDYVYNFTYPGTGDFANDPNFYLAQMPAGPGAIWCRHQKYNEQRPITGAHWAHPKGMLYIDN